MGNVIGISSDGKYMVIKPSGTRTYLALYRKFKSIKGIVHTYSVNAVPFAQAGIAIHALGTTHADYFYVDIPCTHELVKQEVMEDYEVNTGKVIIEAVDNGGYDPMAIPRSVVKNHGPFAWGKVRRMQYTMLLCWKR